MTIADMRIAGRAERAGCTKDVDVWEEEEPEKSTKTFSDLLSGLNSLDPSIISPFHLSPLAPPALLQL